MSGVDPEQFWRLHFRAEWSARPESAEQVASRIQLLTRRLSELEPTWGEIWPLFAARQSEFSRPHVLQYALEELAALIDRRGRYDPPRWPAPVGETGYHLILTVNRTGLDPFDVGVTVHAGDVRPQPCNALSIDLHRASPLVGDLRRGVALVCAMVEAFEPMWVYAKLPGASADGPFVVRPWLTWAAIGGVLPDYVKPLVEPVEAREMCGGRLQSWAVASTPT
jgi:hypothetical protein